MHLIDTLLHARWVLPIRPTNNILENHSIAIDHGKIIDVIPTQEAKQRYSAKNETFLHHHVVMPGLINTHVHAAMNLFRGYADDLALMDWLHNHMWPAEKQWVSPEFVFDGTEQAIAEMIRGGTTTFADMYFFPEHAAKAVEASGMRAMIGFNVMDFPTPWGSGPDDYFAKSEAMYHDYRSHPLIKLCFAPHAPYTVSDETMRRLLELALAWDIKIEMHIHETQHEVDESLQKYNKRPIQRLHDLDALSSRMIAVHMTALNEADFDIIQETQTHIVHCPESNLKLASGFAPVSTMLKKGINVALGTDGVASNNDLNMFGEMRLASLLAKALSQDPQAMHAAQTLEMATIGGAKAMGIEDKVGSLEPGKEADIIAINLNELESFPLYNPFSQLVYATERHQVTDVWVAGKPLLKNRTLLTLNEHELREKAKDWQHRIQNWRRGSS